MNSILTVPNLLSVSRILALVPILYFLSLEDQNGNWAATLVALVAAATDLLDGLIARRYNCTTVLGEYLDPIADKICVAGIIVYLSFFRGNMPVWFTVLVLLKDAIITSGSLYLYFGKKVKTQADAAGKYTLVVVAFAIAAYMLDWNSVGHLLLVVALVSILLSNFHYLKKFLDLMRKRTAGPKPPISESPRANCNGTTR